MSRNALVTLEWADGEYPFRLGLAELEAVQEATRAGPAHLLRRLHLGEWFIADMRAPILHGLLGGGMGADRARAMVKTWVDNRPLAESVPVAMAVIAAALHGAPDDDDDEAEAPPQGKPQPVSPPLSQTGD
jgi:hypothetical protein